MMTEDKVMEHWNSLSPTHQDLVRSLSKKHPNYLKLLPLAERIQLPQPLRSVRLDKNKLCHGAVGARFNGSIMRWRGQLICAYRTGWQGAKCHIATLSDDGEYTPIRNTTLFNLRHPQATYGQEDPRLFIFRDRLHIAYCGVMGPTGPTNVLYARLTDDFEVEEVFAPAYHLRNNWEKNWGFFEWAGELFCVYRPGPKHHPILHVVGNNAYPFTETPWSLPWYGGTHMAGGSSPLLVGDRFWVWFHGRVNAGGGTSWQFGTYTVGVYTFEAKPPFRPIACTPHPLQVADHSWRQHWQPLSNPAVLFPGGAILEDGKWIVSRGTQDCWVDVDEWDAAKIDAHLEQYGQGQVSDVPTSASDRGRCHWLGKRIEHRDGCGGWTCEHECGYDWPADPLATPVLGRLGLPIAIPGGHCQQCSKWESQVAIAEPAETRQEWSTIEGPLTKESAPAYLRIVSTLSAGDLLVDVGTGKGQTALFAAPYVHDRQARMVCVDLWGDPKEQTPEFKEFGRSLRNYHSFDGVLSVLRLPVEEAVTKLPMAAVVFVGAGDWRPWLPKVRTNGVICGTGEPPKIANVQTEGGLWWIVMPEPVTAHVIYCEEYPQRKAESEQHLQDRGVTAHWWRGIYASTMGISTRTHYRDQPHPMPDAIPGIHLSHYTLWQHLQANNVVEALILEDDVELPEDFAFRLAEVKRHLPDDWQFVWLGQIESDEQIEPKIYERIGNGLCKLAQPFGSHCYLVRDTALPILLDKFSVLHAPHDIQLWEDVLEPNALNWCAVVPPLCGQAKTTADQWSDGERIKKTK